MILTLLNAGPGLGKTEKPAPAAPPSQPAPIPEPELTFNGKVSCSLKRRVDLPFKGVITSVLVRTGEQVQAGQVLAKYRLSPEAQMLVRQRLSPPQILEGEIKLAENERALVSLRNRQRELTQLAEKKLAPPQALEQTKRDIHLLTQERATLEKRVRQDRQMAQDDLAVLKNNLGTAVKSGQIPEEAALLSPINGYIIAVSPEMRDGAAMDPSLAVFLVGVMDPMLVRGQAFEIEALQIKTGETAEVTLESLPGQKFQGEVSRIAWSSLTPGLDQPAYYDVELTVPNPGLLLKDGLKARIVFRNPK